VTVEIADVRALGSDWQRNPEMTRPLGDLWLHSGRTALLQVPSAIVPATGNVLINPQHPESAQIRVVRIHEQPIDRRLHRNR
jgi:RES domain-containing protein